MISLIHKQSMLWRPEQRKFFLSRCACEMGRCGQLLSLVFDQTGSALTSALQRPRTWHSVTLTACTRNAALYQRFETVFSLLRVRIWDISFFPRSPRSLLAIIFAVFDVSCYVDWQLFVYTPFTLMQINRRESPEIAKVHRRPRRNRIDHNQKRKTFSDLPQNNCSLPPTKIFVQPQRTTVWTALSARGELVSFDLLLSTRATCAHVCCSGLGIETAVVARCNMDFTDSSVSGAFLQYPDTQGSVYDLTAFVNKAHANNVRTCT